MQSASVRLCPRTPTRGRCLWAGLRDMSELRRFDPWLHWSLKRCMCFWNLKRVMTIQGRERTIVKLTVE